MDVISIWVLSASKLFSISSLAKLAGLCITSPAAIRSTTSGGRGLILAGNGRGICCRVLLVVGVAVAVAVVAVAFILVLEVVDLFLFVDDNVVEDGSCWGNGRFLLLGGGCTNDFIVDFDADIDDSIIDNSSTVVPLLVIIVLFLLGGGGGDNDFGMDEVFIVSFLYIKFIIVLFLSSKLWSSFLPFCFYYKLKDIFLSFHMTP